MECHAKYGDSEKSVLMILEYPNLQDALDAKGSFVKNYENGILQAGIAKNESGKWCGIELVKNFLVAVFNAGNKADVQNLISQAKKLINVSNKKQE